MRTRRWGRPQVEMLEPRALLSAGSEVLTGTLHGTFFAHEGSARTGTVYSLFASGRVAPVGGTLAVGGVESLGFTAHGAGGGNLIFAMKTRPGNLFLRLTEQGGPSALSAGQFRFNYQITHGSGASTGASGTGTLVVTLEPINTNFQGKPVSNPGFFGDATLTFS